MKNVRPGSATASSEQGSHQAEEVTILKHDARELACVECNCNPHCIGREKAC